MPGSFFHFAQRMQVVQPGYSVDQLPSSRGQLLSRRLAPGPLSLKKETEGCEEDERDDAPENQGNADIQRRRGNLQFSIQLRLPVLPWIAAPSPDQAAQGKLNGGAAGYRCAPEAEEDSLNCFPACRIAELSFK